MAFVFVFNCVWQKVAEAVKNNKMPIDALCRLNTDNITIVCKG